MSHYDPDKDSDKNASSPHPADGPLTGISAGQGPVQAQCQSEHDREIPEVDLLSPLTIRGVTFNNRIAMSPMCMYSAEDGFANDFHLVHLGSRAIGGVALVVVEATAVTAEGRISPGDMGIWKDEHIEPLARIANFVEAQGAVPGIQLAHAGRKASCDKPWSGGRSLKTAAEGGWPVIGPSALPFDAGDPVPSPLSAEDIERCIDAWETATRRALAAGFKVIELHAAHGYLMHEFLSPISNQRTDDYGGSLENRMRLLLRVAARLRETIPQELPFFVRISATDWTDGGWDIEQSIVLCRALKALGADLIDVSSGGADARCEDSRIERLPDSFCPAHPRRSENPNRRPGPDYRSPTCGRNHHQRPGGYGFYRARAATGAVLGHQGTAFHGRGSGMADAIWVCGETAGEINGAEHRGSVPN